MGRETSSLAPVTATWGKAAAAAQYANAKNPKCCDGAAERLCSACVCCVCCPLALVWGCLRLPCKAGWRAAKQAKKWVGGGYEERPLAYSSFSDIEFNSEVSN